MPLEIALERDFCSRGCGEIAHLRGGFRNADFTIRAGSQKFGAGRGWERLFL